MVPTVTTAGVPSAPPDAALRAPCRDIAGTGRMDDVGVQPLVRPPQTSLSSTSMTLGCSWPIQRSRLPPAPAVKGSPGLVRLTREDTGSALFINMQLQAAA